ncbi:hypothetical protein HanPI659440_Chr05g0204051 [Helianthus annuus]|nr:hypothetical protein HanPI659440_Chr05g0204051 [Helianthus annuus]
MVLDCNLSLSIRPEPSTSTILANLGQTSSKLGRKDMAERHKFRGLISSITKHMTLVSSTDFLRLLGQMTMNTLSNIRALLLNVDQDLAVVCIQPHIIRYKPDLAAGITHDLFIINISFGGDFAKNHDHVGFGAGFTSNLAVRVLG